MSNYTPGPWKVFNGREIGPVSKEDDQSYGMMLPVAYIEQYDYAPDSGPTAIRNDAGQVVGVTRFKTVKE
jgi:hypothetical protein